MIEDFQNTESAQLCMMIAGPNLCVASSPRELPRAGRRHDGPLRRRGHHPEGGLRQRAEDLWPPVDVLQLGRPPVLVRDPLQVARRGFTPEDVVGLRGEHRAGLERNGAVT